jgi:hypothetical protein
VIAASASAAPASKKQIRKVQVRQRAIIRIGSLKIAHQVRTTSAAPYVMGPKSPRRVIELRERYSPEYDWSVGFASPK